MGVTFNQMVTPAFLCLPSIKELEVVDMVFDLERYIDEPIVYFEDTKKIDDQKLFLLGVKIRSDMVDLLLKGVKAKDITVKKLDPTEDSSYGVINMVAESVLSDWGFELTDASEISEKPVVIDNSDPRLLRKTISNFKISDSKLREGAVLRALQEDFNAFKAQINNELNVFPAPMREMIMMTLLDGFHTWEKSNWDNKTWD